jgi:hypothetical protein
VDTGVGTTGHDQTGLVDLTLTARCSP